jgi:hypothetical protein
MKKVLITCKYCGHKWSEIIYGVHSLEKLKCGHGACGHKDLIVKDDASTIDYYVGCAPFAKEDDSPFAKEDDLPFGMGHMGNLMHD